MTVGWSARNEISADDCTRFGFVFDDDGLPEGTAERLRKRASENVGHAARRKRYDETNRL